MAKHKKTREEKIIADLRHQLYTLRNQNLPQQISSVKPTFSQEKVIVTTLPNAATAILQPSYLYLKHDVLKALMLTLAIVIFQIILLFVLKRHIIILPGIQY